MATDWTKPQREAINARGMEILVSAAAGSGKTAVLTERVKNILSDENNKCLVSEILVVTFTKAAAAEMRERITDAMLEEAELGNGDSDYLRNQILLLPTADICTMDSFCAKLVRENFSKANVNFDYRILDNSENEKINSEAIDKVIDELYEQNDEDFQKFIEMLVDESSDYSIQNIISRLYDFSTSYPFPDKWLDGLKDSFDETKSPNETQWADSIYKYVDLFVDFYLKNLQRFLNQINYDGNFGDKYVEKFTFAIDKLHQLKDAVDNRAWDTMVSLINDEIYISSTSVKKDADKKLKDTSLNFYKEYVKESRKLAGYLLPLEAQHKEDCRKLYPIVSKLCYAVKRVDEVLKEMKREINAYSFSDILHKAIDLLVVPKGNGEWERTAICEGLVERYKEILIDEYQDTNEAQDILFEALSRNRTNLYVVGDVKQSIYRFRKASPAIFMNLKHTLSKYDGSVRPSQITLDTNFRSRSGIDDATNYLFEAIMSEAVGEIDYNDDEKMTFGADYYPAKDTPDSEIICIDCKDLSSAECTEVEAEAIARYIYEKVNKQNPKIQVTVKKKQRDLEYGDFCILLRGLKNKDDKYLNALRKYNIPCSSSKDVNIGDFKEIRILISLIKVINNPMQDIPLVAVMMSPLFGFTSDELAKIRLRNKKAEIYTCLNECADVDPKVRAFLDKIKLYRNISASYSIGELLQFVVDDTGIKNVYFADKNGRQRHDNIGGFINFANNYTNNIGGTLSSFIKHVDSAVENKSFEGLANLKAADGVKIMSIHKSKGLEFPYVFVAACSKKISDSDGYGTFTLARETGIGMKIRDDANYSKYHTVSSFGNENAIFMGDMSESLRLLYVAMTRAKEKLIFVSTISGKQLSERVNVNNLLGFDKDGKLHPYAVYRATNMSEWVLSVFSRHKDCSAIRDAFGLKGVDVFPSDFSVDCSCLNSEDFLNTEELIISETDDDMSTPDDDLLNEIKDKLSYSYEYNFDGVLAKRTASSTEKNAVKREYFARSKPDFMKTKFTGADRGTAIHKFLEKCDFKSAIDDISKEKDRLLSLGIMSKKELDVVSVSDLQSFFNTTVIKRLLASDEILKEYEFSVLKTAGDMYPGIDPLVADEEIVVQGKLDCAFIENGKGILIDYKSDGITDENEFISIYKPQIDIYSEALEKCKNCKVSERYIYSFKLNKFIPL